MRKPGFLWVFWVPFFLILISINFNFTWSLCVDDQKSLLLQLKSNLTVKNRSKLHKLATWNQSSNCCQWDGVQCNNSTGHVIGLDLCGESINGGIDNSSSLFSLQFLQSLNLANNSFFKASIPSAFGKLSGLTYLNLSNSGFSGQVPIEISQLIKLEVLDLSSNSFYLGSPPLVLENPSLKMLIRNLAKIRILRLDGVTISANGSEWGKALSSSVPNLQVLSLSNCNLTGEINSFLEKLHSLSEIILSQNELATSFPHFLANFRNLTVLKLSNCQLQGAVPQKIFKVLTLKILDLSFNNLLQGTFPEFPVNGSLKNLILSFTKFSGQLPNSIGNLKQLNRVELQNCSFSGLIPSSMRRLVQLVHLDLSMNNFSGPIPSFSAAKNLTYMHLSSNVLNSTIWSTNWASLSNLVRLDLSSNFLNGRIPVHLFALPSLQQLQLNQNNFSGQLEESSFSPSLPLNTLDLSNNKLQGSIPKSLFRLEGLNVLKLSFNNFSGSMKLNRIQELKNLTSLELSYNKLLVYVSDNSEKNSSFPQLITLKLGSCNLSHLPDFLRIQYRLQSLDLSNNQIQGRLPNWVWTIGNGNLSYLNLSCNKFVDLEQPLLNITSIRVLDLHSNELQGEIPPFFSSAIYLDYSINNFTSMHHDIGNSLTYAVFFSISGNSVSGVIPVALCSATYLQILDLSENSLSGTVPHCVIKMTTSLVVLNMRANLLNGVIPNEFPKDCSLSTIDISENMLEGQAPRSLARCKKLEVLNLGRNKFNGTFPAWLMDLFSLRVLVLRGNNLEGSLGCHVSNMSLSMLQIIDLSSNKFNGELKVPCLQKLTALMGGANNPQSTITGLQYRVLRYDNVYYQDTVVVSFKGADIKLLKILTLFKSIDFSNNEFQGNIPEVIGDLNGLVTLNLSQNNFSGSIPWSIGNLSKLESLDLSHNNLQGNIPRELALLNFLEVLNLSFNKLVGRIPTGTQLQSFDSSSYMDNFGLCGPPLSKCSSRYAAQPSTAPSTMKRKSSLTEGLDCKFILLGIGFGTGAALVIAPLMFWKKGRKWHDKQVKKLVSAILLSFRIDYTILDEESLRPEEDIGCQLFNINYYEEDDETEDEQEYGRFCVFCTKLDIERKRVIHNPRCTCHGSPSISSSSSKSSSK